MSQAYKTFKSHEIVAMIIAIRLFIHILSKKDIQIQDKYVNDVLNDLSYYKDSQKMIETLKDILFFYENLYDLINVDRKIKH